MKCVNHPQVEAKWQCVGCHKEFCWNCVKIVNVGKASAAVCPVCGERCVDPTQTEEAIAAREPSFWQRLPGIFAYPLQKDGPSILIAGAVFFAIAEFVIGLLFFMGIIFSVLITGYLCRYFFSVMYRSALGKEAPPTWPDFDPATLFEESFSAMIKFVAPAIVGFAPAALYLYFARRLDALFLVLMALGCLYYPMGLAVAVIDDRAGLNPVPAICSLLRAPLDYFATSILFMALVCLNYLREIYLVVPVFALGALVRWLILLYFWTMIMHLLGLFYYTNRCKLQWACLA